MPPSRSEHRAEVKVSKASEGQAVVPEEEEKILLPAKRVAEEPPDDGLRNLQEPTPTKKRARKSLSRLLRRRGHTEDGEEGEDLSEGELMDIFTDIFSLIILKKYKTPRPNCTPKRTAKKEGETPATIKAEEESLPPGLFAGMEFFER